MKEKKELEQKNLDSIDRVQEIKKTFSKTIECRNIILLAYAYLSSDQIYFPTYYEYRGRIYTSTSYLSYQRNSLARGLLKFKETCSIKENLFNWNVLGSVLYTEGYLTENKSQDLKASIIENSLYMKNNLHLILGNN